MKCPIDDTNLAMTDKQGIEIDYCPECRGVWLDRGELDKIIDRSEQDSDSRRPQQSYREPDSHDSYRDRGDSHGGYGNKKRRGSFLSELFD